MCFSKKSRKMSNVRLGHQVVASQATKVSQLRIRLAVHVVAIRQRLVTPATASVDDHGDVHRARATAVAADLLPEVGLLISTTT